MGQACFGPKYETNRTKIREAFLKAIEERVNLYFDCSIESINQQTDGTAELHGSGGYSVGIYDLVIDTSGVGSPLRRYRIQEGAYDVSPELADRHEAFTRAY